MPPPSERQTMSNSAINVGGIYADLDINTGNLDRGLASARQALEAIDREVAHLQSDFQAGAIALTDYNARMQALTNTQQELITRMQTAYAATRTLHTGLEVVNSKAMAAAGGSRNFG